MSKALAMLLLGVAAAAQVGCGDWFRDECYPGYYGCYGPYTYPVYYPDDYLDCYGECGPFYGPYYYDDDYYGGDYYDWFGDNDWFVDYGCWGGDCWP